MASDTRIRPGSEAASNKAFEAAHKNGKPILGYSWEPNWFFAEVPLVHVPLPPYTEGCDADPKKVACDYPDYILNKIVSKKFADTGGDAWTLVKNFSWTNEDQNSVAAALNAKKTHDEAGQEWINANEAKWKAWLPGS